MRRASPATSSTAGAEQDRFTLSRRYAAGTGGTRGLLITVLGAYVRPAGKAVPTSVFIDVLGRFGVEEKATRQALTRAAADGWLVRERAGRLTRWSPSPAFERFLKVGGERIFGFTATQPQWDGWWLVVLARVPEANREGRYLLRTRLGWAGFGNPVPGVWVSTHTDRAAEAELVLREAGVYDEAQIFRADQFAGGDPATLIRQAWNLDEVSSAYEGFIERFSHPPVADRLVCLTELVHAWRRLVLSDPGLPEELLPARWSGVRAAKLFHRQHARWSPAAVGEWRRITESAP